MCRGREDLVHARQGLANQLRAQLECFWPGAAKVFTVIDCPTTLAFLERYPSPVDARYLGEQRLAAFLKRHGYCGSRKPKELLERLRGAADGRAGELEMTARREIVLGLVAALKPLGERIEQLRLEIRRALLAHPDGDTFRSLFIDERTVLCPAMILAEMGECARATPAIGSSRRRRPSARRCGVRKVQTGPVQVGVRSPPAHSDRHARGLKPSPQPVGQGHLLAPPRQRGCTHQHASRILGRAWCQVIWRIWHDHDTYDPNKHTALQRLIATTRAPEHCPKHPRITTGLSAKRQATAT